MGDSVACFIEGVFLLAMGVRLFERAKNSCDWTLSTLFVVQGVLSVLWAVWHDNPVAQAMNNWLPQYAPIVAYLWLAFWARIKRIPREAAKLAD